MLFPCLVSSALMLLVMRSTRPLLSSLRICNLRATLYPHQRQRLYRSLVVMSTRYCVNPPLMGSMAILLSFSTMSRLFLSMEVLLSPSNANPPVIAPSPMIATTLRFSPLLTTGVAELQGSARSTAASAAISSLMAIPNAAEMLLLACPAMKASYSLSAGVGKGAIPLNCRLVWNRSRLPVSILCAYAWCPTSHTSWSLGVSNT